MYWRPTEWTVFERRRAPGAADEVAAREEEDAALGVHADAARALLAETTVLLLEI